MEKILFIFKDKPWYLNHIKNKFSKKFRFRALYLSNYIQNTRTNILQLVNNFIIEERIKKVFFDIDYTSFKLYFEWKVDTLTNSGFMWGVKEGKNYEFPFVTSPEIQIMDNNYPDPVKAGSLYGMVNPSIDMTKPVGQWNSYMITIDYNKNFGNVIFNGTEVVKFPLFGDEWDSMVSKTKFANYDQKPWDNCEFGKFKTGKICFQDHQAPVYFRNIKILEL